MKEQTISKIAEHFAEINTLNNAILKMNIYAEYLASNDAKEIPLHLCSLPGDLAPPAPTKYESGGVAFFAMENRPPSVDHRCDCIDDKACGLAALEIIGIVLRGKIDRRTTLLKQVEELLTENK